MDSVTTVAFLKELERRYDIQVSAGNLIAHPTLESFVGFLFEHHLVALQSTAEHAHDASVDQVGAAPISNLAPSAENSTNGSSSDQEKMAAGPVRGSTGLRMMALAPLDYLFVGPRRFAIQVLYYFEPHLDFAQLQLGLRRVAEAFYPINSHLIRHQEEYFIISVLR